MVIICTKAATFMRRLKTDRSGTKTPVSLMYGKKAGTEKVMKILMKNKLRGFHFGCTMKDRWYKLVNVR